MASVRDDVTYLLRELTTKRTRLIQELREIDRNIRLIEHLDTDNHQLRTHIQTMNRRRRDEVPTNSSQYNSFNHDQSPAFSDVEVDD